MLSQADPKGGFRAARGRSASVRSTSGAAGHEIVFPTDKPLVRHVVDGLQLRFAQASGRDARALAGVAGATPRLWPLPCHGGGSAWTRPCHPPREVAPGQRSFAGRRPSKPGRSRPVLVGHAEQLGEQPVGQHALLHLEAALDSLPGRTARWERPRSGGEDGAVRLHPPRRQSRHAEMGGRSQPPPENADWRRRSFGRDAIARAPVTCTVGAVSGRTAISCPATLKVNRTSRSCHQHRHPAVKTGLPTDGSNATRGRRWR